MHFYLQVVALMGFWQQLCDHVLAMCCNFGVFSRACFVCFVAVLYAYGTLSFWGFQGWQDFPLPKVSPVKLSLGEIPPPSPPILSNSWCKVQEFFGHTVCIFAVTSAAGDWQ